MPLHPLFVLLISHTHTRTLSSELWKESCSSASSLWEGWTASTYSPLQDDDRKKKENSKLSDLIIQKLSRVSQRRFHRTGVFNFPHCSYFFFLPSPYGSSECWSTIRLSGCQDLHYIFFFSSFTHYVAAVTSSKDSSALMRRCRWKNEPVNTLIYVE